MKYISMTSNFHYPIYNYNYGTIYSQQTRFRTWVTQIQNKNLNNKKLKNSAVRDKLSHRSTHPWPKGQETITSLTQKSRQKESKNQKIKNNNNNKTQKKKKIFTRISGKTQHHRHP